MLQGCLISLCQRGKLHIQMVQVEWKEWKEVQDEINVRQAFKVAVEEREGNR